MQTMFMKGKYKGKDVDNTSDKYVLPWLKVVKDIAPRQVMIYTIDRETPDQDLQKLLMKSWIVLWLFSRKKDFRHLLLIENYS